MQKLLVAVTFSTSVGLTGCATDGGIDLGAISDTAGQILSETNAGALSNTDIVAGLKAALETGTGTVVSQLGTDGGFDGDSLIRIPLPNALLKTRDLASKVGLDGQFNELESRLNKAAELATPKAKDLFVGAIRSMSVTDARSVDADLTGHVVEKGSDGIFYYLAEEEKAIRENPLKRTSEILQRVFGGR